MHPGLAAHLQTAYMQGVSDLDVRGTVLSSSLQSKLFVDPDVPVRQACLGMLMLPAPQCEKTTLTPCAGCSESTAGEAGQRRAGNGAE